MYILVPNKLLHFPIAFAILVLRLLLSNKTTHGCFTSIISFGDSLADTGNLLHIYPHDQPPFSGLPPYGETFFHHPSGRYSDGRLAVDFIAESLGLPYLEPFIGGRDLSKGVNFAVAGSTVLDGSILEKYGVSNLNNNFPLPTQLDWFRQFLAALCRTNPDCKTFVQTSLILVGEIGGNDYNYAIMQGISMKLIESYVIGVVTDISSTIHELIKLGAGTMIVPGIPPLGCHPCFLSLYQNMHEKDYDPKIGCLSRLNRLSEYHNELLQMELDRIRGLYPHANIIYGDYYNATMRIYRSPDKFGFTSAFRACCGGGGPYNFNESALCGSPLTTSCDDPSKYVSWDGVHFTETAYKLIAEDLLVGLHTIPHIKKVCSTISRATI